MVKDLEPYPMIAVIEALAIVALIFVSMHGSIKITLKVCVNVLFPFFEAYPTFFTV